MIISEKNARMRISTPYLDMLPLPVVDYATSFLNLQSLMVFTSCSSKWHQVALPQGFRVQVDHLGIGLPCNRGVELTTAVSLVNQALREILNDPRWIRPGDSIFTGAPVRKPKSGSQGYDELEDLKCLRRFIADKNVDMPADPKKPSYLLANLILYPVPDRTLIDVFVKKIDIILKQKLLKLTPEAAPSALNSSEAMCAMLASHIALLSGSRTLLTKVFQNANLQSPSKALYFLRIGAPARDIRWLSSYISEIHKTTRSQIRILTFNLVIEMCKLGVVLLREDMEKIITWSCITAEKLNYLVRIYVAQSPSDAERSQRETFAQCVAAKRTPI